MNETPLRGQGTEVLDHGVDVEKHAVESPELQSPPTEKTVASPRELHGWKWGVCVAAILSTTFLFCLDNTVVADVQPSVLHTFGEIDKLTWMGVGYTLAAGAMILPWSKAYGIFNIKWVYLICVTLFETGSALCGGAPNMNAFIVGRVIAGAGGCGMYVGAITYLSVLTTVQERPGYLGAVGLVWGIGTVLGPVIGGAFAQSAVGWRWGFYINLLIGAVFAPAYFFIIPSLDANANLKWVQKMKRVDWLGNVVFVGFMVCLIMAMNFGGSYFAWNSGSEIALWVVTGVLFIGFGMTQVWHPFVAKPDRLYPLQFLRMPYVVAMQLLISFAGGCLIIPTYYIPLLFQFTRGDGPVQAAVRLLPYIFMVVFFSLANGALMSKLGYYMPWFVFGGAMALIGGALMYTVDIDTSNSRIYGYSVLIGIGVGSYIQASFGVAQAMVDPSLINDAVGFISVGQATGIVFWLSVAGSVFQNKAVQRIQTVLPDAPLSAIQQTIAGAGSSLFNGLSPELRRSVVAQITLAMDNVFILVIVAGALSFLIGCTLKREKLFIEAGAGGA